MFERADLRLWRTADVLLSCSCDLHQVQQPFTVSVEFGPVNVQGGFDGGLQSFPQVVDLQETQSKLKVVYII